MSKRPESGFTYIELMIALMILLLLLPVLFFLAHTFESRLQQVMGLKELQAEYLTFRPLMERDIAQAVHFTTDGELLVLTCPDGKVIRYTTSKRQLIRQVKEAGTARFQGHMVVLRHVYFIGFYPEKNGVALDIGLQNWLADLDLKTYMGRRTTNE